VDSCEPIMHEVKGDLIGVNLGLLCKAICQVRKTPHAHSHGKALALYKASGAVLRVRPGAHLRQSQTVPGPDCIVPGQHIIILISNGGMLHQHP
jgi:hypothetical protein